MEDEDMSEENTVEGNTNPSNCSSNNPGRIVNDVNNNSSEATNVELITASSRPVSHQARHDNSGRWMDVQEKLRQHNHAIVLNMQCHIDALKKYIASTAKLDDNNESNVPDYVWDALKGLECNQQALLGSYNV
jgi:allantoicase